MSSLETRKIEPATGTTVTLGAGGDTVLVSADQLKTNTVKDAGGNTLFTSDGAGTLSSVNSGLQGSVIFISSQTGSSSSSIDFTTGIDTTYQEYIFYLVSINGSATSQFRWQADTTGTSYAQTITSGACVAYNALPGASPAFTYQGATDQLQGTAFQGLNEGANSSHVCSGELHLFQPGSTTLYKNFWSKTNTWDDWQDASDCEMINGFITTQSAITKVRFKMGTGNIASGTIYLYGIK